METKDIFSEALIAVFQDLELYSKLYNTTPQELIKSGKLPVTEKTREIILKLKK
jgi:acyl-CoA hydrolase